MLASRAGIAEKTSRSAPAPFPLSFSASSIAGSWLLPLNRCEGEPAHLRRGRLDQLLVAVAQRRASTAPTCLDIGLPLLSVDEHALPALRARADRSPVASRGC